MNEAVVISVLQVLDDNTEIHKINNETYLFNKKGKTNFIIEISILSLYFYYPYLIVLLCRKYLCTYRCAT